VKYKQYRCQECGWICDEYKGSPTDNIKPMTRWDDVPEDWLCPDCGAKKEDFVMIEV
jgi:rubredoxin-NAD+ reductase